MSKRLSLVVVFALVAAVSVSAASASPKKHAAAKSSHLIVGINDEPDTLYGDPVTAFAALKELNVQVLRVNLYWGGNKWAVANSKPSDPNDPGDPAYNWALYDRLVAYAHDNNIQVMFSILFTPSWANGGAGKTVAPTNYADLTNFAYAAAERYSGLWTPPPWQRDPQLGINATALPKVSLWTAWNEPNNPIWLTPQYKKVGKKWVIWSGRTYAKICNAIYGGIHSPSLGPLPGEQVACGVTGPRGNDAPASARASVDPMSFLTAAHAAGMKNFDVYAHHPYASAGNEPPNYVPRGKDKHQIQLGNINMLIAKVTQYYGPKHFWLTEYGYQTNPPDKTIFGTSWANQALYLQQAYGIARRNPRIDMMLWFLVKDEPALGGWQSGLETASGKKKPSWNAYIALPRVAFP